ncbi:hypothetical protein B0H11DRAFT_2259176 [Mycena galericulata]|nr:hypothetical protein B0H11DRAFT_2259176 [Mycena galericulata]
MRTPLWKHDVHSEQVTAGQAPFTVIIALFIFNAAHRDVADANQRRTMLTTASSSCIGIAGSLNAAQFERHLVAFDITETGQYIL